MLSAEDYITNHWQLRRVYRHLRQPRHMRRLHKCADKMYGDTFADVGCAFGHSTKIMAARHPGHWTGIDFSETAMRVATEDFGAIKQFIFAPTLDMQGIKPFDGVVCSEVIEHVEDDMVLVDALKGITRRVLVITTPSHAVGDPGHLRVYTEEMLRELFGPTGEIEKTKHFWYVTWRP